MSNTETESTFSLNPAGNYIHQPFSSIKDFLTHHESEASKGNENSMEIIRTRNFLLVHEQYRKRQQEREDRT